MSWLDQLPENVEELKRAGRLQQNGNPVLRAVPDFELILRNVGNTVADWDEVMRAVVEGLE